MDYSCKTPELFKIALQWSFKTESGHILDTYQYHYIARENLKAYMEVQILLNSFKLAR